MLAMDVSADLTELGRTPVAVVCSGPKSILDIGRTLEYLVSRFYLFGDRNTTENAMPSLQETQGATVVTYGETNDFPAFYSPKSGFKVESFRIVPSAAEHNLANFRVLGT